MKGALSLLNVYKTTILASAFGVLLSSQVHALTAGTTFQVTATVDPSCVVSATTLAFGTYTPGTAKPGTSTVSVTCTNLTSYSVGLDAGAGTGASIATRIMNSSANTLNYSLYQDSGHATVWGNTVGTNTPAASTGSGAQQDITVYGLIPSAQTPAAGSYSDTINVTVTY